MTFGAVKCSFYCRLLALNYVLVYHTFRFFSLARRQNGSRFIPPNSSLHIGRYFSQRFGYNTEKIQSLKAIGCLARVGFVTLETNGVMSDEILLVGRCEVLRWIFIISSCRLEKLKMTALSIWPPRHTFFQEHTVAKHVKICADLRKLKKLLQV